ncbi:unnamed protein product [Owenia fusiformis]|uniref:Uncharacterized protein n=1 Tax=Owenia fusiformis TaxID=6347 RepID=A0A8J1TYH8_OWEFU|nr:unnamed protein product [Owenia fusiformis]
MSQEKMDTEKTPNNLKNNNWVKLNIGGQLFETSRSTLDRLDSAYFNRLLDHQSGFDQPPDGIYKIDRDPDSFRVFLNFARYNRIECLQPELLLEDAQFYLMGQNVLNSIQEYIDSTQHSSKAAVQNTILMRHPVFSKASDIKDSNKLDRDLLKYCHHNKIGIYLGEDLIRHGMVRKPVEDIKCIPTGIHTKTCDVLKYIKGYKTYVTEKNYIFLDELEDKSLQCMECKVVIPIKRDLGWCHKCLLCYKCQGPWCVSPESFL